MWKCPIDRWNSNQQSSSSHAHPAGDSGRADTPWNLFDRPLWGMGAHLDGRCDRAGQTTGRTASSARRPVHACLKRIVYTICHIITKLELGGAQEVVLYAVSHLDRGKFR